MERLYFSPSTKGFYESGFHVKYPKDVIEVTEKDREIYLNSTEAVKTLVIVGGVVALVVGDVDGSNAEARERRWRDLELVAVDKELNKVQDSDPKAKGSVASWRDYRKKLRAWPEHDEFPNKEFRPARPD